MFKFLDKFSRPTIMAVSALVGALILKGGEAVYDHVTKDKNTEAKPEAKKETKAETKKAANE